MPDGFSWLVKMAACIAAGLLILAHTILGYVHTRQEIRGVVTAAQCTHRTSWTRGRISESRCRGSFAADDDGGLRLPHVTFGWLGDWRDGQSGVAYAAGPWATSVTPAGSLTFNLTAGIIISLFLGVALALMALGEFLEVGHYRRKRAIRLGLPPPEPWKPFRVRRSGKHERGSGDESPAS